MNFEFELKKDDYLNCIKELHKNKKLLYQTIISNKIHILYMFFLCIFFATLNYYFYYCSMRVFLITLSGTIFICFCLFSFKKSYVRLIETYNTSYFGKSMYRKICAENDIFAVYSDKYVVTAHKAQIKNVFETENYYFLAVELGIGFLPLILPKIHLFNNEFTEKYINQIKKQTKDIVRLKPLNQSYLIYTLAIIFCFYKVYDWYSPDLRLGIGITKVPMIFKVDKNSAAEKAGLSTEDVIVKVNGKNVLDYTPAKIIRYMKDKKPIILTVKNTDSGEIKDVQLQGKKAN